jgi:hypothetical protein
MLIGATALVAVAVVLNNLFEGDFVSALLVVADA